MLVAPPPAVRPRSRSSADLTLSQSSKLVFRSTSASDISACGNDKTQEAFRRLSDRFPTIPAQRVAKVIYEHDGHAGKAAAELRELASASVKDADPEDAEHVATLLSSAQIFKHVCKTHFRKFDTNGDGALEWSEVVALTGDLYDEYGLQQPSEGSLRAFYETMDKNGDGVLNEKEFRKFFERYLRYAYFDVAKLRRIVAKKIQARTAPTTPVGHA